MDLSPSATPAPADPPAPISQPLPPPLLPPPPVPAADDISPPPLPDITPVPAPVLAPPPVVLLPKTPPPSHATAYPPARTTSSPPPLPQPGPASSPPPPVVAPPPNNTPSTTTPPVGSSVSVPPPSPASETPTPPPVTGTTTPPPLTATPVLPTPPTSSPPLAPPVSPPLPPQPPNAPPPASTTPAVLLPPPTPQVPPASSPDLPFPTRPSNDPPSMLPSQTLPTPPASTPALSLQLTSVPASSKQSRSPTGIIAGGLIAGIFVAFLLGIFFLLYRDRKGRKRNNCISERCRKSFSHAQSVKSSQEDSSFNGALVFTMPPDNLPPSSSSGGGPAQSQNPGAEYSAPPHNSLGFRSGSFSYNELLLATNGFAEANLLGQGGFGFVYKGCLANGREVAVKRLKEGSRQGDREFQAEVEIIGRVHHKHLVSLVGHCITGTERLLVYEFVPNSTLEFHLHGSKQPVMEWRTRLSIATGSAKGLAYLHEDCHPTIIHRDIKAANILLDHKFDAKLSDFGLAKSFCENGTSITHISTKVVGTFGYLAPEYASSGKVTEKSDVYSFGVILLELVTGRPPISAIESEMKNGLVEWAKPLVARALDDGDFKDIADPRLKNNYSCSEMASMAACALACVRNSAWLRPRMSQVVRVLEGDISANDLNTDFDSSGRSGNDSSRHDNDLKAFNLILAGQQHGISSGTETTSLYGLYQSSSSSDVSNK